MTDEDWLALMESPTRVELPEATHRLSIDLVKAIALHTTGLYEAHLPFDIGLPCSHGVPPKVGDWFSHDFHSIFQYGAGVLEDLGICQRYSVDGTPFYPGPENLGMVWPPFFRFVYDFEDLNRYLTEHPPWKIFPLFRIAGVYFSLYSKEYLVASEIVLPRSDDLATMQSFCRAGYAWQDGKVFVWTCTDRAVEMLYGRFVWKGCQI